MYYVHNDYRNLYKVACNWYLIYYLQIPEAGPSISKRRYGAGIKETYMYYPYTLFTNKSNTQS